MDMPASFTEMMEWDLSDLGDLGDLDEFMSGSGSGVQSSDILGSGNQLSEMVRNAPAAINPVMPTTTAVNTTTNEVNADQQINRRGRKRQRHSLHQIQELESFFKKCPHPDENQRKELGLAIGMEATQIKFWFQNKRTQLKALSEREDTLQLRNEIEKLRMENLKYKEALATSLCPGCGGPSFSEVSHENHNQLKLEVARLKKEIARISSIASKFARMPLSLHNPHPLPSAEVGFEVSPLQGAVNLGSTSDNTTRIYGNNDEMPHGPTEAEKPVITELALAAMDELLQMAQLKVPLWVSSMDPNTLVLNKPEYGRLFSRGIIAAANPKGFKTEASRESTIVKMNYIHLLEALMNVDRWAIMFPNIISRAVTVGVISIGGAGDYDGALQVIDADFQVPSPQVAPRHYYLARYCKKNLDGTWAMVDVSVDRYLCMKRAGRCLRRPSGCLIEAIPNGYTKVTWVEHIEVDNDGNDTVGIYKTFLDSGMAFGAKRWITTLEQQCERIACSMSINAPPTTNDNLVVITPEGKKCILKLAKRMVISFMSGVNSSASPAWKVLSGSGAGLDDIQIMIRKVLNEPGIPSGILLSAATSFWLPFDKKIVFDFLQDEHTRTQWDILSSPHPVTEVARIIYGREIGNSVSLFRDANLSQMMILQESITNPTGSYVIYAPVDMSAMTFVFRGGDPTSVSLLPSGIAIFRDGQPGMSSDDGSLLTVAFQVLVDSVPTATLSPESITTIKQLVTGTVDRINKCLFENPLDV